MLYSGPYSFDAAAVEKVFAIIKSKDLNPANRSFSSRSKPSTYVTWIAEEISKINFGNVPGLFLLTLKACKRYLLFEDI